VPPKKKKKKKNMVKKRRGRDWDADSPIRMTVA
jgi:hypothetical protein